jgi:nitrogen regulatory protein PII 1
MRMIRCIVRPEKEEAVMNALEREGFSAFTKMDVLGRGRQSGLKIGSTVYNELAKTMFMLVVEDPDLDRGLGALTAAATTGNPGDGKIFVSEVSLAVTIRTGKNTL